MLLTTAQDLIFPGEGKVLRSALRCQDSVLPLLLVRSVFGQVFSSHVFIFPLRTVSQGMGDVGDYRCDILLH